MFMMINNFISLKIWRSCKVKTQSTSNLFQMWRNHIETFTNKPRAQQMLNTLYIKHVVKNILKASQLTSSMAIHLVIKSRQAVNMRWLERLHSINLDTFNIQKSKIYILVIWYLSHTCYNVSVWNLSLLFCKHSAYMVWLTEGNS